MDRTKCVHMKKNYFYTIESNFLQIPIFIQIIELQKNSYVPYTISRLNFSIIGKKYVHSN